MVSSPRPEARASATLARTTSWWTGTDDRCRKADVSEEPQTGHDRSGRIRDTAGQYSRRLDCLPGLGRNVQRRGHAGARVQRPPQQESAIDSGFGHRHDEVAAPVTEVGHLVHDLDLQVPRPAQKVVETSYP